MQRHFRASSFPAAVRCDQAVISALWSFFDEDGYERPGIVTLTLRPHKPRAAIDRAQPLPPGVSRSDVHIAPWNRVAIWERQLKACVWRAVAALDKFVVRPQLTERSGLPRSSHREFGKIDGRVPPVECPERGTSSGIGAGCFLEQATVSIRASRRSHWSESPQDRGVLVIHHRAPPDRHHQCGCGVDLPLRAWPSPPQRRAGKCGQSAGSGADPSSHRYNSGWP